MSDLLIVVGILIVLFSYYQAGVLHERMRWKKKIRKGIIIFPENQIGESEDLLDDNSRNNTGKNSTGTNPSNR